MVEDSRKYSSGTKAALFALGKGTCYFPGCPKPVVEETEGLQLVAVQIAHIKGANEGSARFDDTMSDQERAAFSNLMLMCTSHHKLIDGPQRSEYPVELLQAWKSDHESGMSALQHGDVTAENLEQIIESIMSKASLPVRKVEVELEASLWIPGNLTRMPFAALSDILEANAHLRTHERGVVIAIRNTGTLDVTIAAITLIYVLAGLESDVSAPEFTLLGRNDYPNQQTLPCRLRNGESLEWLTESETLTVCAAAAAKAGQRFSAIYVKVSLASGEEVQSELVPWSEVAVVLPGA